jgi:hypothetical protein
MKNALYECTIPPWMIDKIRQQEEEKRRRDQPAQVPLPVGPPPGWEPPNKKKDDGRGERGVVIININGDEEEGDGNGVTIDINEGGYSFV